MNQNDKIDIQSSSKKSLSLMSIQSQRMSLENSGQNRITQFNSNPNPKQIDIFSSLAQSLKLHQSDPTNNLLQPNQQKYPNIICLQKSEGGGKIMIKKSQFSSSDTSSYGDYKNFEQTLGIKHRCQYFKGNIPLTYSLSGKKSCIECRGSNQKCVEGSCDKGCISQKQKAQKDKIQNQKIKYSQQQNKLNKLSTNFEKMYNTITGIQRQPPCECNRLMCKDKRCVCLNLGLKCIKTCNCYNCQNCDEKNSRKYYQQHTTMAEQRIQQSQQMQDESMHFDTPNFNQSQNEWK